MQFQKIILIGSIISKPVIYKHDTDIKQDCMRFEISVSYILKSEVVFPVVIFGPLAEMWEEQIAEGKLVLVEGRVDIDKKGKWRVFADWVQTEEDMNKAENNSK